ncbi:MAG TPA: hypothetical protein VKA21_05995, partial [Candidatus Binatia bacterium]|nr:hypothetical protein [Candidatus Binatia bacterium]
MTGRAGVALVLACLLPPGAGAMPGPGPGEPFGGDDGGCVPATSAALGCSAAVGKAFGVLTRSVAKCHTRQADARCREVVLGLTTRFDEEACEAAARARFDGVLGALAG